VQRLRLQVFPPAASHTPPKLEVQGKGGGGQLANEVQVAIHLWLSAAASKPLRKDVVACRVSGARVSRPLPATHRRHVAAHWHARVRVWLLILEGGGSRGWRATME